MIHFEYVIAKARPRQLAITLAVVTGVFLSVLWAAALLRTDNPQTLGASNTAAKATPAARLRVYTDPVSVRMPGNTAFMKGYTGMRVPAGAMVRTGREGRAGLVFEHGTVTRLDADSQIELRAYNPGPQTITIGLTKGRIWSRVKKLLSTESYRSETDSLVAVVRGTSYGHDILKDGANRATVLEGIVEMQCTRQNGGLRLGLEETAIVDCARGTGFSAIPMNRLDLEDEWVSFNRTEDKLLELRLDTGADVLGVAVTRTPTQTRNAVSGSVSDTNPAASITPRNTPRPSSTPRPTLTTQTSDSAQPATGTQTSTQKVAESPWPTGTPTQTPVPTRPSIQPELVRASEAVVMESPARLSDITVYGSGITGTTYFRILDPQGRAYSGKLISRNPPESMTIQFSNLPLCGAYSIEVSSQAAPQEFPTFVKTGMLTIGNCTQQPAPRVDPEQQ
ncbi:MAG: FecR domain-containing protein [Patescibacteria group bacterium]|nr:FecR domain-containing protein [Patescibacteria group bacterium]